MKQTTLVFKQLFNIFSWIFLLGFALAVLFIISSNSNIFGGYRSYLVQSGSMEPAIMTGDVVVIHPQQQYYKNDTITFISSDNRLVTHRIINIQEENNQSVITTKGDANRSEDNDTILTSQIIGKVALVVPKLGYLVAFCKSLPGLIVFVIVPIIALIVDQLIIMKNA